MYAMKFGGAAFRKPAGFAHFLESVQNSPKPLLIVVSAFADSTRKLYKAAKYAALKHKYEEALKILDEVIDYHFELINDNFKSGAYKREVKDLILKSSEKANLLLRGISLTGEATPRAIDHIISFGEHFALFTLDKILEEHGVAHKRISATNFMKTDSSFGSAKPNLEQTQALVKELLLPALENYGVVITQGFVGSDSRGRITTMGIESSNMTAALLAGLTRAEELAIWTDVEGVKTADPAYISHVRHIPEMSFSQALTASRKGLKLFYPSMIEYAAQFNVPIVYRSAFKPAGLSTRIHSLADSKPMPLLIAVGDISVAKFEQTDHEKFSLNKLKGFIYSESDGIIGKAYYKVWNGSEEERFTALSILNYDSDELFSLVMQVKKQFPEIKSKIIFRPGVGDESSLLIVPESNDYEVSQYIHDSIFSESLVNPEHSLE